jgi:hypothetical protein
MDRLLCGLRHPRRKLGGKVYFSHRATNAVDTPFGLASWSAIVSAMRLSLFGNMP